MNVSQKKPIWLNKLLKLIWTILDIPLESSKPLNKSSKKVYNFRIYYSIWFKLLSYSHCWLEEQYVATELSVCQAASYWATDYGTNFLKTSATQDESECSWSEVHKTLFYTLLWCLLNSWSLIKIPINYFHIKH